MSKRTNRKMAAMVIVKNFCLKLDPSKKNYPLENSTSILKISSITKISPSIGIESIGKRIIGKIAYINTIIILRIESVVISRWRFEARKRKATLDSLVKRPCPVTNVDAERESDKISALVIGCALRQGARIRVCSSNRDTCLLAARNHFLRCRNSRIYTVINTRKHVGWTGWKKICKKRKRIRDVESRESRIPRNDDPENRRKDIDVWSLCFARNPRANKIGREIHTRKKKDIENSRR